MAIDRLPVQYDSFRQGEQIRFVVDEHACVSYRPRAHTGVQLVTTLLPLQKLPDGQPTQLELFRYMLAMHVKLHQVPFHDDMFATGAQASQCESLAMVQFTGYVPVRHDTLANGVHREHALRLL